MLPPSSGEAKAKDSILSKSSSSQGSICGSLVVTWEL